MTEDESEEYVAPRPEKDDSYEFSKAERVLWLKGYGFEKEVFEQVSREVSQMFKDVDTWVVAGEIEDEDPEDVLEKAWEMRYENLEDNEH